MARRRRGDSLDVELVGIGEKPDERLLVVRLVRKVRQDKPRLFPRCSLRLPMPLKRRRIRRITQPLFRIDALLGPCKTCCGCKNKRCWHYVHGEFTFHVQHSITVPIISPSPTRMIHFSLATRCGQIGPASAAPAQLGTRFPMGREPASRRLSRRAWTGIL